MKPVRQKDIDELYDAIVQLQSVDECRKFFRDLLTETEIDEFAERWRAARMLAQGASYTAIEKETGLSSRTIARVHRWLKQGKGGYTLMLRRLAVLQDNT
jgi:TrpR-related protein YerC/YecD